MNPKDLIGAKKIALNLIPTTALFGVAKCMENGAKKYGPFNWRNPGAKVGTVTYLTAALRHIYSYLDGQDVADDSKLHHIDHAIAGLMILRDAQLNGFAIEDRPAAGKIGKLIDQDFDIKQKESQE